MKHFKRTFTRFAISAVYRSLLFLFFYIFLLDSSQAQLPAAARLIVEKAIHNWDSLFATHVRAISYDFEGKITSEAQRKAVVNEITDTANVWMPIGIPSSPETVSADHVSNDTSVTSAQIDSFRHSIDTLIKINEYKVKINWVKDTQHFSTICITDDTTIVYDNMLSNIFLFAHPTQNGLTTRSKLCLDVIFTWIWGSDRGFATASLSTTCDQSGKAIKCGSTCMAGMTLGKAKIECKTEKFNSDQCCQLTYAYAAAVGFHSLEFQAKQFKFKVTGYLGSYFEGSSDACFDCCTPTNTQPSIINVTTKCESNSITINWATISNRLFNKYTIQSSMDGISWNTIGHTDVTPSTSTSSASSYTFSSNNADMQGNFYRIIGEMVTGHKTYSDLAVSPCSFVQNLRIWPNPVAGITTVRIPSSRNSVIILKVTNALGTEVFNKQYNLHPGNNEFQIDLNNLPAGIYSLNATSEGFKKNYKILKVADH